MSHWEEILAKLSPVERALIETDVALRGNAFVQLLDDGGAVRIAPEEIDSGRVVIHDTLEWPDL